MNYLSKQEHGGNNRGFIRPILRVAPLLLIFVAACIFFNKLIAGDRILASGDPLLYFYPYWEIAAEALRSGKLPLWNSDIFMGAPFLANSQVGLFYPLNWLVWLLFPTPYAYSASAYIHVIIGAFGVFLAARICLSLSKKSALLSAILFGLGGYFTAQIEHINQVQGMAWLPYFLVVIWRWRLDTGWRGFSKQILALAVLFALQFFAGHMQAVLITLIFIFVWEISLFSWGRRYGKIASLEQASNGRASTSLLLKRFLPVITGLILGAVLASVQLIPTLELIGHSSRQGGLSAKEALSFSLHPLLLSRAFLPNYDSPLFIEYVSTLPVTGILLALIGAWRGPKRSKMVALILVALGGLLLSLGIFNPLNQLLVRLPVFNLFRVPARWLLLVAFTMSLLAGSGLEYLFEQTKERRHRQLGQLSKPLLGGVVIVVFLIIWTELSVPLSKLIPIGAEAVAVRPSLKALLLWLTELSLATLIIYLWFNGRLPRLTSQLILIVLATIALYGGTRTLPYNNPTAPEAYFDMRPPSLILHADTECEVPGNGCLQYEGRFLSLSDIFFDVGDQPEIDAIYAGSLSESALYDFTIATKQKEIVAPNLSMVYSLPSVDGFGGGILPLQNYSDLTALVLPQGERSTDGRLREHLEDIPEHRWLDLFNARYLITDKVGDRWVDDVFFDMQFPTIVSQENGSVGVGHIIPLESTELWLLTDSIPGGLSITFTDGVERTVRTERVGNELVKIVFSEAGIPSDIVLHPCEQGAASNNPCSDPWRLNSLALVDSRDGAFQPLVAGDYRLIHSGDVKIYENLDVLPRAFLVSDWISVPTNEIALQEMTRVDFNPGKVAVIREARITPTEGGDAGTAQISKYEPDFVSIDVQASDDSYLVLSDANYAGWKATIDGEPTPILDADILFRGVFVPQGDHIVEFTFLPRTFVSGLYVTVAGLIAYLSFGVRLLLSTRENSEAKSFRT